MLQTLTVLGMIGLAASAISLGVFVHNDAAWVNNLLAIPSQVSAW